MEVKRNDRKIGLPQLNSLIRNGLSGFDIHCRMMDESGKYNLYFSEVKKDNPNLTVEAFILFASESIAFYGGSFWLCLTDEEKELVGLYQLVGEDNEPL